MNIFVTGGLGFLGTHIVRRLGAEGHMVTLYDRASRENVPYGARNTYIQGDILNMSALTVAMRQMQPQLVIHLAALADVRNALKEPQAHVQLNFQATANVLEAMRETNVPQLVFTSSAVVYGAYSPNPVTETHALGQQTSIYGAMKLASESLIQAYCEGYGMRADIFRLVSVVGEGYRHGNLMDFYHRLRTDPTQITVLGNRQQPKYYIYVDDVVDAIMCLLDKHHVGANTWNVSAAQPNTIDDSIDAVCNELHIDPTRIDGGTVWAGDLPSLVLDTTQLRALGWHPQTSIHEGMRRTVQYFIEEGL